MKCSEILERLEELAPVSMACDWDNPGLLAGRADKEVATVFLALDATDQMVEDAVLAGADLILTHHPLIFKPVKSVTDQDFIGRRLLKMIKHDISYAAMHTNFDAAPGCMADLAADRLGLTGQKPLEVMGRLKDVEYGIGKMGELPEAVTLEALAEQVKKVFGLPFVTVFGLSDGDFPAGDFPAGDSFGDSFGAFGPSVPLTLKRAAICPGSGGSLISEAVRQGAEVYITGDISHHQGIDAVAEGMAVIDAGHYGIEHIFMDFMEQFLTDALHGAVKIKKPAAAFPCRMI